MLYDPFNVFLNSVYYNFAFVMLLLKFSLYPFFVVVVFHFIYNVSQSGTLCKDWSWPCMASGIWMSVSFPRLGTFLAIISSSKFSAPFSFFFLWNTYNATIVHVMLFQRPLKLSQFLNITSTFIPFNLGYLHYCVFHFADSFICII